MNKHPEGGEGVEPTVSELAIRLRRVGMLSFAGRLERGEMTNDDALRRVREERDLCRDHGGTRSADMQSILDDFSGTTQKPDEEWECSECGGEMGCEVCTPEGYWPVLSVAHFQRQNEYKGIPLPLPDGPVGGWVPAYPVETYYPESAPNVLSPEEAQQVVDNLHTTANTYTELRPLFERLADYAEKGTDHGDR